MLYNKKIIGEWSETFHCMQNKIQHYVPLPSDFETTPAQLEH